MHTRHALLAAVTAALMLGTTAVAADFEAGQIWSAKGREKDPDPKLLVLRVESDTRAGDVVFIAVSGVKICLPDGKCGDLFSPLAMTKAALDRSVKEQVGRVDPASSFQQRAQFQFERGYQSWKDGVAKGAPVTVTVPLAEALDQIEGGSKIQVK
jgi:hypothetical protein